MITIGLIRMVAALNIVASLVLLVMEKSRDIAIQKTMGTPSGSIRGIFVLQAASSGAVGTTVGRRVRVRHLVCRALMIRERSAGCRLAWHLVKSLRLSGARR